MLQSFRRHRPNRTAEMSYFVKVSISAILGLTGLLSAGCAGGKEKTHIDDASAHRRVWSNPAAGVEVSFHSTASGSAFYVIGADGKSWIVQAPVYHPQRRGVDGLKMKDYAGQNVFISPNGNHLAIIEDAGGENAVDLLISRAGDRWTSRQVSPAAHLYDRGTLQPGSRVNGIDGTNLHFDGNPVRFDQLRAFHIREIYPQKLLR